MTQTIHVKSAELPEELLASVDVAVCGGGPAGVAAAVTCARAGLSVVLIEKNGFCGGAAVAGLSGTICGLYLADESYAPPRQIVTGFAEEFLNALKERNGVTGPQRYGKTYVVTHDPLSWRETADAVLETAGVQCLFHTTITGVIMDGSRVMGIRLSSSAGECVLSCSMAIDATGDGMVAVHAGCGARCGNGASVQYPTMMFRMADVDTDAFLAYYGEDTIAPEKLIKALTDAEKSGRYSLPRKKIWIFPTPRKNVFLFNTTKLSRNDGAALDPISPVERTTAEIQGRRAVREYERFFRENIPGCSDAYIIDTGTEVGVRQTRSIDTYEILTDDDVVRCRKRPGGIVKSAWPIELHGLDKPQLHWLLNDYYEIPYLTLVPRGVEGLLVAGRCFGAEHAALASARVTAQCFEMGHAAGLAAGLALADNLALSAIDVEKLRNSLRKDRSNI